MNNKTRILVTKTLFYMTLGLILMGCQNSGRAPLAEGAQVKETINSAEEMINRGFDEIKATRQWKIAYVVKSIQQERPYWMSVQQAAKQAGQDFEVEMIVVGPDAPPVPEFAELQIAIVVELIEQGDIDGLIIGPMDSTRLVPVVEKAIAAGIPVIAQGTPINSDQLLTFVGLDNQAVGKRLGLWVAEKLNGQGNILILGGPAQQQNAIDRRNGFIEGLSQSNVTVLDVDDTDWTPEAGQDVTAAWLEQYAEIDAIIGVVDQVAIGASQAVALAEREGILIAGVGGYQPEALELIRSGEISVSIAQVPDLQARRGSSAYDPSFRKWRTV